MSKRKDKTIKDNKFIVFLYGEDFGYIETKGFSSRKDRSEWTNKELKSLKAGEKIYAEEDKRKADLYFAIFYDFNGAKTS